MSNHVEQFVEHLNRLRERDRGALAILRRSLSFAPGAYPPSYPYVERFVGMDRKASDSFRLALYLVAGLYALHPETSTNSLATGLAELMHRRNSGSIEGRFLALLGADSENLAEYLRHAVTLFAADNIGINYTSLFGDLVVWLNPYAGETRDQVRQTWARDFYGTLARYESKSDVTTNRKETK
jgi:CRISPR system Cascade subunit CasB